MKYEGYLIGYIPFFDKVGRGDFPSPKGCLGFDPEHLGGRLFPLLLQCVSYNKLLIGGLGPGYEENGYLTTLI